MKYRSYNREFRTATAQILNIFNDITIDRRDAKDNIEKLITVPCVYGNRSSILKSLENGNKTLKIPLITLNMDSISRDTSRVHSTYEGITRNIGGVIDPQNNTPVPVNISYSIDIITKYQEDQDQILCNFIPFFNPDIFIVWPNPKIPTKNIKSQIVWDGNFNFIWPSNITPTDNYRYMASTSFTLKTWIFAGMTEKIQGKLIHKINFDDSLISKGNTGYHMDRWYDVPNTIDFDSYIDQITSGNIINDQSRTNYDYLQMSGGISGYFSPISANITGTSLSQNLSSGTYISNEDNEILITNHVGYFPRGMSNMNLDAYFNEYN